MRVKEQLAKQYTEKIDDGWSAKGEAYNAWLAGFNTAKQLLEKQIRQDDYSIHVLDILALGEQENG